MGIGFGIMLNNNGYGVLWAAAMSIFIYAGSMQYVGVSLLSGGATIINTIITTLERSMQSTVQGSYSRDRSSGQILRRLIFSDHPLVNVQHAVYLVIQKPRGIIVAWFVFYHIKKSRIISFRFHYHPYLSAV